MKVMCTFEPLRGECEYVAASMKKKKPIENCGVYGVNTGFMIEYELRGEVMGRRGRSYESSGKIDACCSCVGAVEPGWLGEAEEVVGGHFVLARRAFVGERIKGNMDTCVVS